MCVCERERERQTDRQRETETEREREREREIERERQRQREREREGGGEGELWCWEQRMITQNTFSHSSSTTVPTGGKHFIRFRVMTREVAFPLVTVLDDVTSWQPGEYEKGNNIKEGG